MVLTRVLLETSTVCMVVAPTELRLGIVLHRGILKRYFECLTTDLLFDMCFFLQCIIRLGINHTS